MSTIALLARQGLRRHWGGWVLVAVLTALTLTIGGGTIGVARETLTAHRRLLDAAGAPDLTLGIGNPDQPGPPTPISAEDLLAVDGVAELSVVRSVLGTEVDAQGQLDLTGSTGLTVAISGTPAVPMLRGRMPADDAPDEVAISRGAVDALGADVGQRIRYAVVTFPELASIQASGARRGGTIVEPMVVGVFGPTTVDGPLDAPTSTSSIIASRAFLDSHPGVGTYQLASIWLQDDTTVSSFLRTLEDRFGPGLDISTRADIEELGRRAIRPEAMAVIGLAVAAGLAGLIVTAQTITRQVNDDRDEVPLLAMGLDRNRRAAQRWAQALVAVGLGALVGVLGAMGVTAAAGPIGIARAFDRPGVEGSDLAVAWAASGVLALLLTVLAAVIAWRSSRVTRKLPPSPPTWTSAVRWASPLAVRTGAALAGRGTGAHRAVRGAVVGAATSVAVIVVVITFTSSLDRLVATPSMYGQDYDLSAWDGYGIMDDDAITAALTDDPAVTDISRAAGSSGTVNGREAGLVGYDSFGVGPRLTSGTLPGSPGQVLLGRRLADRLGVAVGADVSVVVGERRETYRVVGMGVTPDDVGDGAAFTIDGIRRVAPDAQVASQYVRLQPSADPAGVVERVRGVLECEACDILRPAVPSDLAYLDRVGELPRWSVAIVILLGGAMALHALLVAGRRSRRSVAVLRSLGASRSQVTRCLVGQAMLIALAAIVIGVVAGLVLGRALWSLFADQLGVVPSPTTSAAGVLACMVLVTVVATAASAIPAHRSAIRPIVPDLRAD